MQRAYFKRADGQTNRSSSFCLAVFSDTLCSATRCYSLSSIIQDRMATHTVTINCDTCQILKFLPLCNKHMNCCQAMCQTKSFRCGSEMFPFEILIFPTTAFNWCHSRLNIYLHERVINRSKIVRSLFLANSNTRVMRLQISYLH